ncbi:B-cell receptor-associated protein 31 [Mucuna pruriens]|uniref:Endoplasmic reticulum transmembrane protein n=1 Tax=Mucuna pruriens TaxID=157652 RepID=A0A371EAL3_MUCPR|nr:B-cell receptor-associated protein 31 [Mucuna pruriens]
MIVTHNLSRDPKISYLCDPVVVNCEGEVEDLNWQDDSASVHVDIYGGGDGGVASVQDTVEEACDNGLGSLEASLYSILKIHNRGIQDSAAVNPTDQVLMAKHLLEATLMGAVLFLALMIDRLHHYIRELRIRRKGMEVVKKQTRGFEDGKVAYSEEIKAGEEERARLRAELGRLESELLSKTKDADVAEANVTALRKQSEGFLLEYDRLLEENQNLRNQLQSLDRKLSYSGSKKNI